MIEALLDQALRALRTAQTKRAIQLLRQALAQDPDLADAHALLALCLHDEKRLAAAEYEARAALTLAPELSLAHYAMGRVSIGRGSYRTAEQHLNDARALGGDDAACALAFALLYGLQRRRADELRELEHARSRFPEDADVLAALGEAYRSRGRLDDAESTAHEALATEPENADALVLMGHIHLAHGRIEEARDHALWVLQNDATEPGALSLLAAVKTRQSLVLGLWWRYHSWLTALGETRAMLVLLGTFAVYRVALVLLKQSGMSSAQEATQTLWLAMCAYTWVGPGLFQRSLQKELRGVELKGSF